MRYETLTGDVVFYSEALGIASYFNRNNYEHLYEKRPRYHSSDRELAETYPGAKSYLKEKLKEEQQTLKELSNPSHLYQIRQQDSGMGLSYGKEQEVNTARIAHHQEQIQKAQARVKRLSNILYFMDSKAVQTGSVEEKIRQAKAVPITSLLTFNYAGFAKCPLHNEATGSFKYYPQGNRWHCYGCNTSGDSIDLIMRLKGLKFLEAVDYLAR